tara:strand:- start:161 stop:700 length:540 start_codon:yes stop_codon:yes gene_type:complete
MEVLMKSPFAFVCMFSFLCWLRGWLFFLPSCCRVGGGNFITSTNKFFIGVPRMITEYYTASGHTKFIAPEDKDGWSPFILIKLHEPKEMWLNDTVSVLKADKYDVYIHTTRDTDSFFVMGLIELCNTIKEFDRSFGKSPEVTDEINLLLGEAAAMDESMHAGEPPELTQADLQGGSDNE